MANIIGTDGNDTLLGINGTELINGLAGNDTITGNDGYHTLTGGGGKDTFVYESTYLDQSDIITDFGGVGKGTNPTAAVIGEVDTLKFQGADFTAKNLLLTQNGSNLYITFEHNYYFSISLQNFALENLDNLSKSTGATVKLGNILFDGQTSVSDSFDVFNANSTQSTIFNKNTVTFLNDLDNNVSGFDNSDDVINSQGGDDIIDGKSGNDLLRGGTGNDTLIGGAGNDTLIDDTGNNSLVGGIGDDTFDVEYSSGDNTLNGGTGNDTLSAGATSGNNLLFGGDGNDYLDISYIHYDVNYYEPYDYLHITACSGNNTLNGGAGNDTLKAVYSIGNNLLFGGDGNDYLTVSSYFLTNGKYGDVYSFISSGNNTLNGGAGDDTLRAEDLTGNNILSGGDGNDYLFTSGFFIQYKFGEDYYPSLDNNTLNGGAGNDTLRAENSISNDILSGGDGNDSFYLSTTSPNIALSYLVTQTVDGGKGDDLLSVDYMFAIGGITTTFNFTTNISSITAGRNQVSYKNIERLNISGTYYDDYIVGSNGNDTLSGSYGNDTINGGKGDDLLSVDYMFAIGGITTTFNPTTNITSITAGTNQVSYKNIERLNISGTDYDDYIVGSNGNDTLSGGYRGYGDNDTIIGGAGNDILTGGKGNASLYGGAGTDTFVFNSYQGVDQLYDFNATNELIQINVGYNIYYNLNWRCINAG